MKLRVVPMPNNVAHIRIDSGIYVATDVPLDMAEELVRRYNLHEELATAVTGAVVGFIKGDLNDAVLIDGRAFERLQNAARHEAVSRIKG